MWRLARACVGGSGVRTLCSCVPLQVIWFLPTPRWGRGEVNTLLMVAEENDDEETEEDDGEDGEGQGGEETGPGWEGWIY